MVVHLAYGSRALITFLGADGVGDRIVPIYVFMCMCVFTHMGVESIGSFKRWLNESMDRDDRWDG